MNIHICVVSVYVCSLLHQYVLYVFMASSTSIV